MEDNEDNRPNRLISPDEYRRWGFNQPVPRPTADDDTMVAVEEAPTESRQVRMRGGRLPPRA
jgi:hypothetical protein